MNAQRNELRRDLGLWSALALVVGTVIGSGIFRVPQAMVLSVGSVKMVFLVWIVGGILSLAGALTYAELSAAMPGAGGEYVYLTEAWGPMWGFLYGWTQMWVAKSGSIATLATAFFATQALPYAGVYALGSGWIGTLSAVALGGAAAVHLAWAWVIREPGPDMMIPPNDPGPLDELLTIVKGVRRS